MRQHSGTLRWSYQVTSKARKETPFTSAPTEVTDSSLYVGLAGAEKLFRLDKADASLQWSYAFGHQARAARPFLESRSRPISF